MSINDRRPVDDQPRVGEVLLTCAHIGPGQTPAMKIFRINQKVPFTRPNGSKGEAKLLACCYHCFYSRQGDLAKIQFCRDSTWQSRHSEGAVRTAPENDPK